MEVGGQLHAPVALPIEKELLIPSWIRGWMDPTAVVKRNIPRICLDSNPRPSSP
jgi:hypothetical protein